jgi:hypothetical protein
MDQASKFFSSPLESPMDVNCCLRRRLSQRGFPPWTSRSTAAIIGFLYVYDLPLRLASTTCLYDLRLRLASMACLYGLPLRPAFTACLYGLPLRSAFIMSSPSSSSSSSISCSSGTSIFLFICDMIYMSFLLYFLKLFFHFFF